MKKLAIATTVLVMIMAGGVGAAEVEESTDPEFVGPPISAMMKPDKGIIENSVSFFKEAAGSVNPEFTGRFYLRGGQLTEKGKFQKYSIPFYGIGAEGDIKPSKSLPLKLMGKIEGDTSFGKGEEYQAYTVEAGAGLELTPYIPFLNEVYSSVLPFYSFGHKHWSFNKQQDDFIFDEEDPPFTSRWDVSYHRIGVKTSTSVGGWGIGFNAGMLLPTRAKNVEMGQISVMLGETEKLINITRTPKIEAKNSYFGGLDVKKGRFVGGIQYEGLRFDTTTGGETSAEKNDTFTLKLGWEF